MTTGTKLAFVPRGSFFCKDGRGWHTSASGRGHGLPWPWPSTVLGALRSAWGRAEESRTHRAFDRDDWRTRTRDVTLHQLLALRREHGSSWTRDCRMWPVPADAVWMEGQGEVVRLDPAPATLPTLGRDDDPVREALWRPSPPGDGKPMARPQWWGERDFVAWLRGDGVSAQPVETYPTLSHRLQTHVGIRPEEGTADEGVLFSHDVTETLESGAEWALGLAAAVPSGGLTNIATLGSDSRLARIETLPDEVFEPPKALLESFATQSSETVGLRMVAVTPACFRRGWLPDGFEATDGEFRGQWPGMDVPLVLRAACIPRPLHISGWDMALGQPKPTSRMLPPGAVLFLKHRDGESLRFSEEDVRKLWLAQLGERSEEGYGRFVPGIWHVRRNS